MRHSTPKSHERNPDSTVTFIIISLNFRSLVELLAHLPEMKIITVTTCTIYYTQTAMETWSGPLLNETEQVYSPCSRHGLMQFKIVQHKVSQIYPSLDPTSDRCKLASGVPWAITTTYHLNQLTSLASLAATASNSDHFLYTQTIRADEVSPAWFLQNKPQIGFFRTTAVKLGCLAVFWIIALPCSPGHVTVCFGQSFHDYVSLAPFLHGLAAQRVFFALIRVDAEGVFPKVY